ncbi:unnamed protein product [Ectocarpus sp. 4 AP-2014]
MSVSQIEKLTKKTILALIRGAGGSTGRIWWRKDDLPKALRCVTGGDSLEDSDEEEGKRAGAAGEDKGGGGSEQGGRGSDAVRQEKVPPGQDEAGGGGEPGRERSDSEDEYLNQPVFLPGESTSQGIVEQPLPMREGMTSGKKRKRDELTVPACTRST